MDEDVSVDKALNYPDLYKSLQKGRELNLKTFLGWLWKSIYQVKNSRFFFIKFSAGSHDNDSLHFVIREQFLKHCDNNVHSFDCS